MLARHFGRCGTKEGTAGLYLSASLWLINAVCWTPFPYDPSPTRRSRLGKKAAKLRLLTSRAPPAVL